MPWEHFREGTNMLVMGLNFLNRQESLPLTIELYIDFEQRYNKNTK